MHPDREYLKYCLKEIEKELAKVKLSLNKKTHIFSIKQGLNFMGFRFILKGKRLIVLLNNQTRKRITKKLNSLSKMKKDEYVMFKFTIPDLPNFYDSLLHYKNVVRIVALSGGYDRDKACELLKGNKKMIASFSRALLEGLNINQNDEEFSNTLKNSIEQIYNASVKK